MTAYFGQCWALDSVVLSKCKCVLEEAVVGKRSSQKKGEGSRKYCLHLLSFYYLVVISVHTGYIVLKVLITMHMKLFK